MEEKPDLSETEERSRFIRISTQKLDQTDTESGFGEKTESLSPFSGQMSRRRYELIIMTDSEGKNRIWSETLKWKTAHV